MMKNASAAGPNRAQWISEVLNKKTTGTNETTGEEVVEARLKAVEELLLGEIHEILGGPDGNVFDAMTENMNEVEQALDGFESRLSSVEELGTTITKMQSQLNVLAQFVERFSPFLKGMEDAFASETSKIEETRGGEDVTN